MRRVSEDGVFGGLGPIVPIPGLDAPDAVSIRDPFAMPGR